MFPRTSRGDEYGVLAERDRRSSMSRGSAVDMSSEQLVVSMALITTVC